MRLDGVEFVSLGFETDVAENVYWLYINRFVLLIQLITETLRT